MQTTIISPRETSPAAHGVNSGCPACGELRAEQLLAAPDRFHGRRQFYQLDCCSSCGLVWLKDPPAPESMGEHYGPDYDRWVAAAGNDRRRSDDRVETVAQYKNSGSLLDLGCSSGAFLQAMKNPNWRLFGIEMSEVVANRAQSVSGAEVFVGDILDAPFEPESFDVITCFHVFEHLYEPVAVLKKVAEWLKPGGIFFVMVPNIDSAGAHVFKSFWYALELPRHLYHFSPKSLHKLAESTGLEEVSIRTYRELFFEKSVRYCVDEVLRRVGLPRTPLAYTSKPALPVRALLKAFRLTILPVLKSISAVAGSGESVHAILRKPVSAGKASER